MKKIILLFIIMCMTQLQATFKADDSIEFTPPVCITVNGSYIKTDSEPYLLDGVTYVPVRAISEALKCDEIEWHQETKNVVIKHNGTAISMFAGEKTAYINNKEVTVSGDVFIKNDRTYVPVRFISESLDADVLWDNSTYTVKILKDGITVPNECIKERTYTDSDLYWMSRIIHAESAGEPNLGKIAVGNVVINRVKSSEYPNTVYDVIFDTNYGVQFQPVLNGTIYNTPTQSCIIAAKLALNGESVVNDSLFFLNENTAQNFWIVNNRTYLMTIGNHSFYL